MNEYERKFRTADRSHIDAFLQAQKYQKTGSKKQEDTYFLVNNTNNQGQREYLRVREDHNKGTCSLDHHIILDDDTTQENEVEIEDANQIIQIIKALGHQPVCVVKKDREVYGKDNVEIVIDHIDKLGTFVEVETRGKSRQHALDLLEETCKQAQLTENDRVRGKGYPDLLINQ